MQILQKSNLEEIKPSVLVHDKGTSKRLRQETPAAQGTAQSFLLGPIYPTPRIYQNRVLPSLHLSSNSFQGEQPGISISPLPVPASPNFEQFSVKLPTEGEDSQWHCPQPGTAVKSSGSLQELRHSGLRRLLL